jgi:low temperature requirement protein LtrA
MLFYVGRHFEVFPRFRSVLKIILASVVLSFVAVFLPKNIYSLFWGSALLLSLYGGILILLGQIKKEDLEVLRKLVRRGNK